MNKRFVAAFCAVFFTFILSAQAAQAEKNKRSVVILVSQNQAAYDKLDVNDKLYARSAFQSFVGNLTLLDDISVRTESNDSTLREIQKQSQIDAGKGLAGEDSAYASDMASKATLRIELSLVKYKKGYKLEYSASNIETMQIVCGGSSDTYFEIDNIDVETDKLSYSALKALYGKGYVSSIPYAVEVQLTHSEDTWENYTDYIKELEQQIEENRKELEKINKDNLSSEEKAEAIRQEQALQLKILAAENAKRKTEEQLRKYEEEKEKALKQEQELKALAEQKRNDLAKKFSDKIKQSQEQQDKLNKEITQGLSLEKRIEIIETDRKTLDELEAQLIAQIEKNASDLEAKRDAEIDEIEAEPWRLAETDSSGRPTDKARKYRDSKITKVEEKYAKLISDSNNDLKGAYAQVIATYEKQIADGIADLESTEFVYRSYEKGSKLVVTVGNYDGIKYNWAVVPVFNMQDTEYITNIPDVSLLSCTVSYKDVTGKNPVEYDGKNETAYNDYMDSVELADICFRTSTPFIYGILKLKVKYNETYGDYRLVFNGFTLKRMEDNLVVADFSLSDYNAAVRGVHAEQNKTEKQKEKEKAETQKRQEKEAKQKTQEIQRQEQHKAAQSILSSFINYWTPNFKQKNIVSIDTNIDVLSGNANVDLRAVVGGGSIFYYMISCGIDDFLGYENTSVGLGIGTSLNFGCFRPYTEGRVGFGIKEEKKKTSSDKDVDITNFRWGTRSGVDLVAGNYLLGFFMDYEGRVGERIEGTQNFVSFGLSLGYSF